MRAMARPSAGITSAARPFAAKAALIWAAVSAWPSRATLPPATFRITTALRGALAGSRASLVRSVARSSCEYGMVGPI
jgi:hypothetical protein